MDEPIQASVGDEGKVTRDLRAEGGMTLGIVKRTEEEFADWLGTEWGFISGLGSFDDTGNFDNLIVRGTVYKPAE